jgi:hypothetical protein
MSAPKTVPDIRAMTPEQRIDFTRELLAVCERLLREQLWELEELREMWYWTKDALAQLEANKAEIDARKKAGVK